MAEVNSCRTITSDIANEWEHPRDMLDLRAAVGDIVLKSCADQCSVKRNRLIT
jgi:hypothetical protein